MPDATVPALTYTSYLSGRDASSKLSGELVESVGGRRLGAGTRQRSCTEYGRLERPPARHMRTRLTVTKRRDHRAVRACLLRQGGPTSPAAATHTRCVLFPESFATLGDKLRMAPDAFMTNF